MIPSRGLDVTCCLRRKYAEQFKPHIESGNDQMLICLIPFPKSSIFRGIKPSIKMILKTSFISVYKMCLSCQLGSIQITNAFDASVVTLNPTMQETIDFKQK